MFGFFCVCVFFFLKYVKYIKHYVTVFDLYSSCPLPLFFISPTFSNIEHQLVLWSNGAVWFCYKDILIKKKIRTQDGDTGQGVSLTIASQCKNQGAYGHYTTSSNKSRWMEGGSENKWKKKKNQDENKVWGKNEKINK